MSKKNKNRSIPEKPAAAKDVPFVEPEVAEPAFEYELDQKVELKLSQEAGYVHGRAEYLHGEPMYEVYYKDGNGCQSRMWCYAAELK